MISKDRYDVVIVGAGPLGLASAYHLAEEDPALSILVVDARSGPGEGSMGASNSMVRDVFSSWDNRVLARSSIEYYRHLMARHEALQGPVPLLDLYGYLWLLTERQRAEYARVVNESHGALDASVLDLGAVRGCPGLEATPRRWYEGDGAEPPEPVVAGLFGRLCGALAPETMAGFYCEESRKRGVEFAFDTCVRKLSFEGREEILLHDSSHAPFGFQEHMPGRLRISRVCFGDERWVGADTVVVAAGAWADSLLRPLGVASACAPRPQVSYSVSGTGAEELLDWSPPVRPIDAGPQGARMPFLILPTGATLKPVFRQRHLWLGCVDTVTRPIGTLEDPGRDGRLEFDMSRFGDRDSYATDLLPSVTPYLPRFEGSSVRLERVWGGYYNFSPDGLPVLTEESYGVVFVGGDSGSGIMKADALGRLVAARCRGKASANLFTGETYRASRLSLTERAVEPEQMIL